MPDSTSLEGYTPEQRDELAKLAKDMSENPATRREFLRLTKKHSPGTPIPEIDIEDRIAASEAASKKEMDALQKKILEGEVKERIRDNRQKLRDKGFSEEEIAATEKLMVDKHIPSHEIAGEHYRLTKQAATPTPASLVHVNKMPVDGKTLKESGGIKKWGQNEAHKAIDEIRSGKVRLTH